MINVNVNVNDKVKIVNYDNVCTVLQVNGNQIVASDGEITFICAVNYITAVVSDIELPPTDVDEKDDFLYDFDVLLPKQKALMKLAANKTNITDVPVVDVITWLLAEVGEVLNEAKFFKYCRKIEIDKTKLLEELTDCLFLFLELGHLTKFHNTKYVNEIEQANGGIGEYDQVTDLHMEFSYFIKDITWAIRNIKRDKIDECNNKLYDAYITFCGILAYYKFTNDEVIAMYNKKYEVNVKRLMDL